MGGGVIGKIATTVAPSIVGGVLNQGSKRSASKAAKMILPTNIRTGRSSYNTRTGRFKIDPSIRAGQDQNIKDLRGIQDMVGTDFDTTMGELAGIRGDIRSVRDQFDANADAYRESMLNPLRESIARREGELDQSLRRRDVAGSSFGEAMKTNFAIDSGRALTDATGQIENQRINQLGDFIGMDADIIKEGIRSREGRSRLIAELEQIIGGRYDQQMAQEMDLLGMPARFMSGGQAAAQIKSNAEGVDREFRIKETGNIIEGLNNVFYKASGASGK